MDLGERVKSRREEIGWTQEELAKRMGYSSRVSINKIEKGRPVTQKIIVRLAEALDTSPAWLMGWDEASEQDIKNSDAKADITNRILEDDGFFALVDKLNRLNHDQFHDAEKILDLFFKQIFDQQKD